MSNISFYNEEGVVLANTFMPDGCDHEQRKQKGDALCGSGWHHYAYGEKLKEGMKRVDDNPVAWYNIRGGKIIGKAN